MALLKRDDNGNTPNQVKSDSSTVTGIAEEEKAVLEKALLGNGYGEGLINSAPNTWNKAKHDVYNTKTQKKIEEAAGRIYFSEANSDKFPIGIRKTVKEDGSEIDVDKRYYIDANGTILKNYTKPIGEFSKAGIAVITDEVDKEKRQFIDTNFNVMSVDGVSTFDSIASSMKDLDHRIYLVGTNGKQFILNAHLKKILDSAFSDKDKINIMHKAGANDGHLESFIVIGKEFRKPGGKLEFYDLNGNPVSEENHKEFRYLCRNFESDDTNFKGQ